MKAFILGIVCTMILSDAALAGSPWVLQQSNRLCLRSDHVASKTIIDDRTILFRMDDGTEWKNTLQHQCVGLKLADGFKMVLRDNYVCGNQQPIKIIGNGNTCYLGDFAQVTAPPAAH